MSCDLGTCSEGSICAAGFRVCIFFCTGNDDCPDGEICAIAEIYEALDPNTGVCAGEDVVKNDPDLTPLESQSPPPSPDDGICIDVAALGHLSSEELICSCHPLSRVLFDAHGSCATAGHIVRYDGKPMMMKTYCSLVGCESRVMRVNSPRYRIGMRVQSKTDGLEYTALAARHETLAEQTLVSTIVRMGF